MQHTRQCLWTDRALWMAKYKLFRTEINYYYYLQ